MHSLKTKAAATSALLLLCLLWASASLRSDLLPGSASAANSFSFSSQAILLAIFGVAAGAAAIVSKVQWPRGRTLGLSILVGFALFVLPAVLVAIARGSIDDSTRLALFSLVPIFTVILSPHLGSASISQPRGGLAAGLVAVAGTLLVFPIELPQTLAAVSAFAGIVAATASVAAANCIAVRLVTASSASYAFSFAAVVTGSAALILGPLAVFVESHASPASLFTPWLVLDLLALALLFWLMRHMTAVRMTTRFLVAPLLVNLIGLAFLRPGVQLRGWLGLSLIALGSGWLLLAPEDEPERAGSSLSINLR